MEKMTFVTLNGPSNYCLWHQWCHKQWKFW